MIYLGILLILVSSTAARDLGLTSFFLGLVLLAIQTFEFRGLEAKKARGRRDHHSIVPVHRDDRAVDHVQELRMPRRSS